ncbi:hypothetical protein KSP40_PGU015819 [Platanthera guangdongensis]|uniref:Uncharacterized protein n=1 Tax=Platanthera guangdongensis TaxID=2320717 RepID=A0ABR2M4Y7_9ASPA
MARVVTGVLPLFSRSKLASPSPAITAAFDRRAAGVTTMPSFLFTTGHLQISSPSSQRRIFRISYLSVRHPRPFIAFFAAVRGFRNVRWRQALRKQAPEEKKVEFRVKISAEEGMSDDHEIVVCQKTIVLHLTPLNLQLFKAF